MPARKHKDLLLFDWLSNWSLTASIYRMKKYWFREENENATGLFPQLCAYFCRREKNVRWEENLLSVCNVAEGVWPVYYENFFFRLPCVQFFHLLSLFPSSLHYKFPSLDLLPSFTPCVCHDKVGSYNLLLYYTHHQQYYLIRQH